MNPALYDALASSPMLQSYARAFRRATGLMLRLAPAQLETHRCHCANHGNRFCTLIHRALQRCPGCTEVLTTLSRRLQSKLGPQLVCCRSGLTEVAVPVFVGGEHVATLFGGQVLCRPPTRRDFARVARQVRAWGVPHAKLPQIERAYFVIPVVPRERFRAMVELLAIFAQNLSELAGRLILNHRNGEPHYITQARAYLREHIRERVHIPPLARHVGLSPAYFCRTFKKHTGMTVSEFTARLRVETAKQLLADCTKRISEVAFAAGFQSIPHFDRTFKRFTGLTPQQYRTGLNRSAVKRQTLCSTSLRSGHPPSRAPVQSEDPGSRARKTTGQLHV